MMFDIPGVLVSILALVGELLYGKEVPPPSNITVNCNNFHTMVYWNYSHELPHTTFTLTIGGSSGHSVFVTDKLHYNLTWLVWGSAHRSMDLHSVTISAGQGERQSQTVEKSFTFNDYNTADVKCYLDLPVWGLSVKDLKATVIVVNPLHVYEELKLVNSPLVEITVHLLNVPGKHRKMMNGWICTENDKQYTSEFCFPEHQEKYCIELEGRVFNNRHMYSVLFRSSGPVCVLEPVEGNSNIYTAVVVGGAVIGGVGAVAAAPFALAALGFTSAGITAGSYAASMMSSWALANGGGVLGGSVVAFLQSSGVLGFSPAVSAVVGTVSGAVSGAVGALVGWWTTGEDYSSSLDCRGLLKP